MAKNEYLLYGYTAINGVQESLSHSSLTNLADNSHRRYLQRNTVVYNDYLTALFDEFICLDNTLERYIPITSIVSQDATSITFQLYYAPSGTVDVVKKTENGIKWMNITPVGNQITITNITQELILANNTQYIDDNTIEHANPLVADVNSAVNIAFDRIKKSSVDVIGMTDENTTTMDYASNNQIADNDTLKAVAEKLDGKIGANAEVVNEYNVLGADSTQTQVNKLDTAIGNRTYTNDNYVVDAEAITTSIDSIDTKLGSEASIVNEYNVTAIDTIETQVNSIDNAIGNRTYTYNEVLTDGESVASSLEAIDGFIHTEFYAEEYGFEAYQDFVTVPAQTIYTITEDANADTPYVITDLTKVVNNIDLFSVTDSTYKPIYKEGTIFKTATNMVVVSSYNPTTGEVILNGTPKTNFRINYTLKYNRKNVPDGKLILASNVQNVIEVPEEEEETSIQFDTTNVATPSEGEVNWNADDGTLQVGMPGGNVILQLGQEQILKAKATEDILNGQVVFISGASGANPEISLGDNSLLTTSTVIGVATEDINNNNNGYVTTQGKVNNINTLGMAEGSIVWLGTGGNFTTTRPNAPLFNVVVGIVLREHATEGVLFVKIDIIPRMQGLSDVYTGGVALEDGQFLSWNGSTSRFEIQNGSNITKESTGFTIPENVIVTYNSTARTITLTGTVNAYWRGRKISALTSGWVSDPHPNVAGRYFLVYDGNIFQWLDLSVSTLDFSYLQIAYATYNGADFGIREPHGLMQWQSHRANHLTVGTYKLTGGTLGDYVLSSTTATNRRPSIASTILMDEDLPSTLDALPTGGLYTWHWLTGTGTGTSNFSTDNAEIVSLLGSQPYYNQNNAGTWQQTLVPNNAYMAVWVLAIPTTADTGSKKYRYLFIQGQNASTTLSNIQAITPQNISLGSLSNIAPESVFIGKIILRYTGGNWSLTSVENLTGTRVNQTLLQASGAFLTAVTTDSTLTGNGTIATPLRMSGTFTPQSDSTTAYQFFKADGTTKVADIDTTNKSLGVYDSSNFTKIYGNSIVLGNGVLNSSLSNTGLFYDGSEVFSYTDSLFRIYPALQLDSGIIKPDADSTTAIQFMKADGATPVLNIDTTNSIIKAGGTGAVFGVNTTVLAAEKSESTPYVSSGTSSSYLPAGSRISMYNPSLTDGGYASISLAAKNAGNTLHHFTISAISNPTGYGGDLAITTRTGASSYAERLRLSSDGTIYVSRNSEGINTAPSNTFMNFIGANGTTYRFNQDSFATFALNSTRHADGVLSVKTNSKINNTLYKREAYGYGTTGYTVGAVAGYRIIATENYTDSANGSKILWYATPTGSTIPNEALTFDGRILYLDGNALIGTTSEVTRRKLYVYSNDATGDVFIRNENASTTANTGAGIELRSGSTDFYITSKYALGGYITMADNYPIVFSTNNVEKMRIYTDGQYDFGTSSSTKSSIWLRVDQLGRQPGIIWDVAGVKKSTWFIENEGTLGKTTLGRYDSVGNFVDRPFQMYHDTGDVYISQELNLSKSVRIGNNIVTTAISKTLALTDNGYLQKCTNASSINITVPPNSSVAFPVGTEIPVVQYGAGDVAFLAGAGVTINSESGKLKINGQYITAVLKKMATDEWLLSGNLKA